MFLVVGIRFFYDLTFCQPTLNITAAIILKSCQVELVETGAILN